MGRITYDQVYEELLALGAVDAETVAGNLGIDEKTVISYLVEGLRKNHVTSARWPDGVRRFALTPLGADAVDFEDTVRRTLDYLDEAEEPMDAWRVADALNEELDLINRVIQHAANFRWINVEPDGRVKIAERGQRKLEGDIEFGRFPSRSGA